MANSNLPPQDTFKLVLSETISGKSVLENPECTFFYHWDFEKNMGLANLLSINGSDVNIVLHPLGIEGQLDFMSDMEPTQYSVSSSPGPVIAEVEVVIYRVILDIDLKTGNKEAALMLGEKGETIISTPGFDKTSSAKELPPVEFERPQV